MKSQVAIYSLNGGEVGDDIVPRIDLDRLRFAASFMENSLPAITGKMSLRPGFEMKGTSTSGNLTELIPFAFTVGDTAVIELSDFLMNIRGNDDQYLNVNHVATNIIDGDMTSIVGWTDSSTGSASISSAPVGMMTLHGAGFSRASATQSVPISISDQDVEHTIIIDVERGPVVLRIGTTTGDDDLVGEALLEDGHHVFSFTPNTATIHIEMFNSTRRDSIVDSCDIHPAGVLCVVHSVIMV